LYNDLGIKSRSDPDMPRSSKRTKVKIKLLNVENMPNCEIESSLKTNKVYKKAKNASEKFPARRIEEFLAVWEKSSL